MTIKNHTFRVPLVAAILVTVFLGLALTFIQKVVMFGSYVGTYGRAYLCIISASLVIGYLWRHVEIYQTNQRKIQKAFLYILIGYGLVLLYRAVMLYYNYDQFVDLSYYESAVSQFASFQLARIWDIGIPLWSQHFEPVLFLLVPWYWVGLGGGALLVLAQAAASISGAIPLYSVALERLGKHGALSLSIVAAYLLFGGLQSAYFYGFHPIAFFPVIFLFAVLYYERKQYGWYVAFLLLSLCVKEGISFVVMAWGAWLLIGRKDVRYGIITILCGIAWYVFSFAIISHFHNGGYEYWGQFGGGSEGGALGIIRFAFMHPIQFLSQFFDDERKAPMLIEIFGSFGFLPLLAPLTLIFLAPSLLLKLLSHDIAMMNSFHYSAEITPLLALSAIEGVRRVMKGRDTWTKQVAIYLTCVAVFANMYYGFIYFYQNYAMPFTGMRIDDFFVADHSKKLDAALQLIPTSAGISCEYAICSHIQRPLGEKIPAPNEKVLEYVIIDKTLPLVLVTPEAMNAYIETKIKPSYELIHANDGIYLLKRKQ